MTHRNGFVILAALLLLLAAACTGCTSPAAPAAPPASTPAASATAVGNTVDIAIKGFTFNPSSITVDPGTTVTWTNGDSAPHTIVSAEGAPVAFRSETLPGGGRFSFTFTVPGTYVYHCSIHPSMTGTIIVRG